MTRADDGVQIGIVSLVPSDCRNPAGSISTFTSVARNLPWIRRVMNGQMENMDDIQQGSITIPVQPSASTSRPVFQGFLPNVNTINRESLPSVLN